MKKNKVIRVICDIFIFISLFFFVLFLIYFIHGSLETDPTGEQQEKIRLTMALMMLVCGMLCLIFKRIKKRSR